MVNEMKDKVKKEYYRRPRKELEMKFKTGDVFKAVNTWAVSVVRILEHSQNGQDFN